VWSVLCAVQPAECVGPKRHWHRDLSATQCSLFSRQQVQQQSPGAQHISSCTITCTTPRTAAAAIQTLSSCSTPGSTAEGTHSRSPTCALEPDTPRVGTSRGSDASCEGLCETDGCTFTYNSSSSCSTYSSSQGPAMSAASGHLEVAAADHRLLIQSASRQQQLLLNLAQGPVTSLPPAATPQDHTERGVHAMLLVLRQTRQPQQVLASGRCRHSRTCSKSTSNGEAPSKAPPA